MCVRLLLCQQSTRLTPSNRPTGQYYAPAVTASPAAPGGGGPADASGPSGDDADADSTTTPAGGDPEEDSAGAGPGGENSELSWLLPPGASSGCQAVLDINGEKPATIMQTFQTVRALRRKPKGG